MTIESRALDLDAISAAMDDPLNFYGEIWLGSDIRALIQRLRDAEKRIGYGELQVDHVKARIAQLERVSEAAASVSHRVKVRVNIRGASKERLLYEIERAAEILDRALAAMEIR